MAEGFKMNKNNKDKMLKNTKKNNNKNNITAKIVNLSTKQRAEI